MKQITGDLLAQIFAPTPRATCVLYAGHAAAFMPQFSITTVNRAAAFFGQVGIESKMLTKVAEDLNYKTPSRLDAMFSAVKGEADAAALIRRGPQAIGTRVYAGRLGNGDEASGDGWRYRGLGLIQLTGKENQAKFGAAIGMALDYVPAYLTTPKGAMHSACWYFAVFKNCNALADGWQISAITLAVNGKAMEAAAERLALSNKARAALA